MVIREIGTQDTQHFFDMMCRLDSETEFMMYEPGERLEKSADLSTLKNTINRAVSGGDLLLVAEHDGGELAGFLWAERGTLNRVRHTAYIVTGIRQAFRHQGLGTAFFKKADEWAAGAQITRLELTVECQNTAALSLYEHAGFVVEGTRRRSMKVNGRYVDEYYMAKLF